MTVVGHSIMGATLAVLAGPRSWRPVAKVALAVVLGLLACGPDFRLPYWGHYRYEISHSIFVNLAVMLVVAAPFALLTGLRRAVGGPRIVAFAAAAWLSHLLLDTFYNHSLGLAMFWPASKARVSLAIPWFASLSRTDLYFNGQAVRIWGIELLCYGSLFCLALLARRLTSPKAGLGEDQER